MSSCSTGMARLETVPTGFALPAHLRDGVVETRALTGFVLPVGVVETLAYGVRAAGRRGL